ncbi:unnamed protein product, partial [Amoebophrya sp. A25]
KAGHKGEGKGDGKGYGKGTTGGLLQKGMTSRPHSGARDGGSVLTEDRFPSSAVEVNKQEPLHHEQVVYYTPEEEEPTGREGFDHNKEDTSTTITRRTGTSTPMKEKEVEEAPSAPAEQPEAEAEEQLKQVQDTPLGVEESVKRGLQKASSSGAG